MILTEKEKVLLGIARTCLWWCDGADFERAEVMLETGWHTKVEEHYPIKYPGDDEYFANKQGLPEDCSTEEFEACNKKYDKAYKAWCNQYTQIWQDASDLLDRLGATTT